MLAELTISYETNFEVAAGRKEEKYDELVTGACNAGYETELITLEISSRGVINPAGFHGCTKEVDLPLIDFVKAQF